MASNKYYPEDVLVEKIQSGEYGWLAVSYTHLDVYKRQAILCYNLLVFPLFFMPVKELLVTFAP